MNFQPTDTSLPIESEYPKLIRDKIPEIISSREGRTASTRILQDDGEYLQFLLKKILEEATELSRATDNAHIAEETADVYEVIDALLELKGLTRNEVFAVQREKREKRGGFQKRLLMLNHN